MTDSPLVERVSFRDSDHTYYLDGKRIPSVTALTGNLSKDGLVWWSAKVGAEAMRERAQQVDPAQFADLHHVGDRWDALIEELYQLARYAHNNRKRTAAKKGNAVHDAIQAYHTDFFTAEPPTEPAALASWTAFIEWWASAGLTCIATERKIVDPEGRYSGRLDMLCEDAAGDLYVCDTKTSGGVYDGHVYQNALYAGAIEAELERPVAGTCILWLPEGAEKLIVVDRDREEWREDYRIASALIDLHSHRAALSKWLREIKETHGPKEES